MLHRLTPQQPFTSFSLSLHVDEEMETQHGKITAQCNTASENPYFSDCKHFNLFYLYKNQH